MDFYHVIEEPIIKKEYTSLKIYPDFKACRSKDLMIRGRSFYAIWDKEKEIWSTDEYDVQRLVDQELEEYKKEKEKTFNGYIDLKRMINMSSNMWKNYRNFIREMSDNSKQLDNHLTFSNTDIKKSDYVSRRLPYPLEEGSIESYDALMSTLYDPDERSKLEWAIGGIVAGDAKNIQKFIVLYGEAGSGKSTFLNIVQKLFDGYYTTFEAKALTSNGNSFSTEVFRTNPLVAIQHDGDLSKIEDNTKLNSIISHEEMTMNEKYKPSYTARSNAFLFMGTNKPVKITDAKSGIIRRLIDVKPSGRRLPSRQYQSLIGQIDFELGGIAYHCLQVYQEMGKNYYSTYRPLDMIFQTDVFFNFVESNYHIFKADDGVSLSQAYDMYKSYCDEALVDFKLPKHKFREELKSYFEKLLDIGRVDGKQIRNYYTGFMTSKFVGRVVEKEEHQCSLVLDNEDSLLDKILCDCPAQYANDKEIPDKKWVEVTTKLSDIDTKRIHYVRPPLNHIVIDFDLKDSNGKKSAQLNLEAATKWPPTYSEFSKSGSGIHLHYIYDGDVQELSRVYSEGIEIKVFNGSSSLRRRLSKCNNSPVATINSGLPLKGVKVINFDSVQSEKGLRDLIDRNMKKEFHQGTKPSVDFIWKILEDAYSSGMKYDITDMRPKILVFANNSSNQSDYCIKLVNKMHFHSDEASNPMENYKEEAPIFYDVEVFPNLFVVCWKKDGSNTRTKMINPSPKEIEELLKFKLVGFNCRRYDNHIMYARYLGWNNEELYKLSQKIVNESKNCMFGEAYNLSYTDVYDFASAANKKGLKKFEIELGLHHQEIGLPWDQPVDESLWEKVADYCCNDVDATEAVFHHLSGDWAARQILASLSGLTVNDTTNQHSTKIIFGEEKNPQSQFVYTDLSIMFPGYTFQNGKSFYRGEEVGEGGYVYAEPGMYSDVPVLDIVSMHPTSTEQLNMFGPYTKIFSDIKNGRVYIKRKEFDMAKKILNGKLAPFIVQIENGTSEYTAKDLSSALKTVINSVYGLTSARFDNKFKDPRNKDNIVAKRGALFMIDLKHAVQEKGFTVAHIKTDSIKIPNATPEIIDFVMKFGAKYGYEFEHEDTYSKFCLVNDSVYIAKSTIGDHAGEWIAVGAQFAHPYVFKTLFSKEKIEFSDLAETKAVSTALYLDMNEGLEDGQHEYHYIGKVGSFCPIKSGCGGGVLLREKDGSYDAATRTKGYRWLEDEMVQILKKEDDIDLQYFNNLVDDAVKNLSKYGDFEWFSSDVNKQEDPPIGFNDQPPLYTPCGMDMNCKDCSHYEDMPWGAHCSKGHDITEAVI